MWKIISKSDAAEYARMSINSIDDLWYDTTLGLIEVHTGWASLDETMDDVRVLHGTNTPILLVPAPINSITYIKIDDVALSDGLYHYNWNKIYMKNASTRTSLSTFPTGIANIEVSYNVGGITSLPDEYQSALKATLLLCIKEFVAIPRNEGSDQVLRKYRPDRTMMPEETLKNYGVHGKIMGIIRANLPSRIRVT